MIVKVVDGAAAARMLLRAVPSSSAGVLSLSKDASLDPDSAWRPALFDKLSAPA